MENIIENFLKGDKIARENGFYEAVTMDMPVRMAFATSTSLVLIISIAFVVLQRDARSFLRCFHYHIF